ncbi:DUF5403 family protein [Streptomyces sp. NPDC056210]|uniref:DUF5403 family protein n=1 Tax=Streptomyces sp. NPDC056210 TaxID=3345746 RepID=UPI0035E3862A
MKIVLDEQKCKTVPASDPKVNAELRKQALDRAHNAKTAAAGFSDSGQFRGSIHVKSHEKGYSVDIDDPNALSIIFGHNYAGWAEGHMPFEGHPEIIAALLA